MSTKQQTLKAPISFSGKGLHTGVKVNMTVNPADAGTGIVFRRTDIEGQPIIPALCDNVVDTSRGTTIEAVKTLEENNFRGIVGEAVDACVKRSQELSK